MTFGWLSIHTGLAACIGVAVSSASPAFAQSHSERAAFACMQLDEESAYADLQNLGWHSVMPVELSPVEKETLATEHYLFKAQRPNNPHKQQSFEETAKIAIRRVEQQMARNASASSFSGGAVFRNSSTRDLVSIQTENLQKFERTTCTFFYTQETAPSLYSHARRTLNANELENTYVTLVGTWNKYHDGIQREVQTYLWNNTSMSEALQREFPVELMVVASVWQHAENKKGDE
ncbi:hypothetical protein FGK63_03920 [Ruegeria sediminis]|uniref:Uncharacterized protein n=1 Tax=Ruegeria sediminis TaxID=2583820 RepID=A0ABY2X497_9RHOB|nr:hypothetical protein [Ruegeria sediminis]TMV10219.1 hypothetical protein FGK63_03920 [Ruegeria sediminis]